LPAAHPDPTDQRETLPLDAEAPALVWVLVPIASP